MIFSIFKEYQNICRDAQKTLKMEKKKDYDVVVDIHICNLVKCVWSGTNNF